MSIYDRSRHASYDIDEETGEALREIVTADYVVFLLAFDTYLRWLKQAEAAGMAIAEEDDLVQEGLALIKYLERINLDTIAAELRANLSSQASLSLLEAALRPPATLRGISLRTMKLRVLFTRNMTGVTKAIFGNSRKALQMVRDALEAAAIDDPDQALAKISVIDMKNPRLEKWVDKASETATPLGTLPVSPVENASKATRDSADSMFRARVEQAGAVASSDQTAQADDRQRDELERIQADATRSAEKALGKSGEDNKPVTKAEAIGVATAAVAAAMNDPTDQRNIPSMLKGLDPEQLSAAMASGRVLVAAGAGSGKTHTLTSRVAYLVQDQGVDPSKILVCCFNTKAARELKERISARVGGEQLGQMAVGTMHSIFRRFVVEYGTPEQKAAVTTWLIGGRRGGGGEGERQAPSRGPSPGALGGYMSRVWKACKGEDPPRKATMLVQKWQMNDISPKQAAQMFPDKQEEAEWYEWWLGFKGVDKQWSPPCRDPKGIKQWQDFLSKYRDGGRARLGDFSDMILMFRDLLRDNPGAKKKIQGMFDHIAVDEAQDLNEIQHQIIDLLGEHIATDDPKRSLFAIGDESQCIHEDTPVSVESGVVLAKDLKDGDAVLSYRNGQVLPQAVTVSPSSWEWGYKITTESGKTLTMSPNHRIWVSEINPEIEAELVYLMYRHDLGFRVGTTKNGRTASGYRSCVNRMRLEGADKIWFLKLCVTHEDALLEEASYSLQYGIPTAVFEGEDRGINQDRLDALFRRFGDNGRKLLNDLHLEEALPHWTAYAATHKGVKRRVIQMVAHSKSTLITFEWSGTDLHEKIGDFAPIDAAKLSDRYRIRKYPNNYRDALAFALELQRLTGALLNRRLSVPGEEPYQLVNAAGVFAGMRVVVRSSETPSGVDTEEVTSVEKVEGRFLDLDVDDASNFFGGGILSHNSINAFAGARPDLFVGFQDKGFQLKNIATNYRCLPEIIELANNLMREHPLGLPLMARPDPKKPRGKASIVFHEPATHADAAIMTMTRIAQDVESGQPVGNYAVLTRTNREINDFETACIIQGIPYARRGSSSFLQSPETVTVMSYINLVTGQDYKKMQQALAKVLNNPNRWLGRRGEEERVIASAVEAKARRSGVSVDQVNPLDLFDREGVEILLQAIDPYRRMQDWQLRAAREQISSLGRALNGMRSSVDSPGDTPYTTQSLIGDILTIPGAPEGNKPVVLRDVLMPAGFTTEEEQDDTTEEEKEKPVGNVQFLFMLAQPTGKEEDPSNPRNFRARLEKLNEAATDLRVDLTAWDVAQQKLPPSERKNPPCITLSTIHCSPPDEPVLTTSGWVPMGDLDPTKHRLASYDKGCNQLRWGEKAEKGFPFLIASREYNGDLITVQTLKSRTRVTPNHKMLVKFSEAFAEKYVVYLMRRGDWWRMGLCVSAHRPYKSGGVSGRLATEKADAGWILKVCSTREEALMEEAVLQTTFGIPGTTFEVAKGRALSLAQLHSIHESIKDVVGPRAREVLSYFGLSEETPLYVRGAGWVDKREAFVTEACNLLGGYMDVPTPAEDFLTQTGGYEHWFKPEWHTIQVHREKYTGSVYSVTVVPHRYYVSGGIVVHNSVKGAQWPNVTVVMAPGVFPHRATDAGAVVPDTETDPALREARLEFLTERQLAYVAFTRAGEDLTVLSPHTNLNGQAGPTPRFVGEAGLTPGQNVAGKNDPTPSDTVGEGARTVLAWGPPNLGSRDEPEQEQEPEPSDAKTASSTYDRSWS